MPDLPDDLRRYIDAIAEPATATEIHQLAADRRSRRARRRTMLAGSAAAAIAVGAMFAATRLRQPDGDIGVPVDAGGPLTATLDQPEATPTTLATPTPTPTPTLVPTTNNDGWLSHGGVEPVVPPLPEGWRAFEYGDLRFGVPEGWSVQATDACDVAFEPGMVVVRSPEGPPCGPDGVEMVLRQTESIVEDAAYLPVGAVVANVLPPLCDGCPTSYRFPDSATELTTSAPAEAIDPILATLAPSSRVRATQEGQLADTTGWQQINYAGVSFSVPADWRVDDLPAAYVETGNSVTGLLNPDACGAVLFGFDTGAIAVLGESPIIPECPATEFINVPGPGDDGVWLRPVPPGFESSGAVTIAQGARDGLTIRVIRIDPRTRPIERYLDLEIDTGTARLWLTLGVSHDPSIARSILRSITSGVTPRADLDGPVIRSIEPFVEGMPQPEAEVRGRLVLEGDCLAVVTPPDDRPLPIIWPSGTTWDPDRQQVTTAWGAVMTVGDDIQGGGAYGTVRPRRLDNSLGPEVVALLRSCISGPTELVTVNGGPGGIGPG